MTGESARDVAKVTYRDPYGRLLTDWHLQTARNSAAVQPSTCAQRVRNTVRGRTPLCQVPTVCMGTWLVVAECFSSGHTGNHIQLPLAEDVGRILHGKW